MLKQANSALLCAAIGAIALLSAGCGADETTNGGWTVEEGDGSQTEYGSDTTTVTTPGTTDSNIIVTGDPDECVDVDTTCVDLEEAKEQGGQYCDDPDAQADVIVADGEVVDVICYPPKEDGTDIREADTDEEGNAEVPQTESGSVVTFNEKTDGEPIVGDVNVDAERTTLYGNGPDKTIIDGKITIQSNHARIRGMTVTGNVEFGINSNNSAISFCRIQGDLNVKSNEFTATNCEVFGKVQVTGNGATLVNIGVQGDWDVNANADCRGCYSFTDENDDFLVQDEELGEELTCQPAGPPA
ncbi:hypothetical protein FIV42_02615 [Persicimonas caeni]|uniref:Polymer-forming cytoskeletal protein n=1 Tax=Persicimonas caeni TaxID=2292766 RepID=A0A4Y6PN53_PERCE|nr:hypothetical protein [Persicimonas caeni]QDG49670.1 hypothetical protein FIV42_02615 [Persicimonas caeni]QED30891.1 hypothetical protein FRD00_02610 [Persicimonas caeni]